METNKIHNENCLDTMARMKDNFIDLTVTSPPYDNLRTYNGYSFDFESIAKEPLAGEILRGRGSSDGYAPGPQRISLFPNATASKSRKQYPGAAQPEREGEP